MAHLERTMSCPPQLSAEAEDSASEAEEEQLRLQLDTPLTTEAVSPVKTSR